MSEGKRVIRLEEFDEDDAFEDSEQHTDIVRRGKKKRGLFSLRNLIILLLILGGTGAFLPQLIAWTPLGDVALGYLVPSDKGSLRIQKRDLAWWKPVDIGQVELRTPDGKTLATVNQIKTKRTLWEIASKAGVEELTVDGAIATLELREGGSNFEDFIAQFATTETPPPTQTKLDPISIKVLNSEVSVKSDLEKRSWLLTKLNADVQVAQDATAVFVQLKNEVLDSLGTVTGGKLNATISYALPEVMPEAFAAVHKDESYRRWKKSQPGIAFSVQTEKLPAGLLQSLASRVDSNLKVGGIVYGNITGTAGLTDSSVRADFPQLTVMNLNFANPNWIGADVVRQQRVDISGGVELVGGFLQLVDTRLRSDIGVVTAKGQVAFSDLPRLINQQRLPNTDIASTAKINVAGLAKQLPSTLHLKQDIALNSGVLQWEVFNQKQNDGSIRLFADVSASGIQGSSSGQNFRWANPVRLSGALRDYGLPIDFETLKIESDFLGANLNPTADGGIDGKLNVDFDRMRTALQQVFTLPPMQMAGRGSGTVRLSTDQPGDNRNIAARLALNLTNVNLSLPGFFELQDPSVQLTMNAGFQPKQFAASDQKKRLWRFFQDPENLIVSRGFVQLTTGRAGQGQPSTANVVVDPRTLGLAANLKRPVDIQQLLQPQTGLTSGQGQPASDSFAASVQFHGAIDRWLQIVRPLLTGVDVAATGFAQGSSDVEYNANKIQVTKLDFKAKNVGFRGFGLLLNEPDVIANGDLDLDLENWKAKTPSLTVACRTAAVRAVKLDADFGQQLKVNGDVYFQSDVERLWDTIQKLQQTPATNQGNILLGMDTPSFQQTLLASLSPGISTATFLASSGDQQAVERIASRPRSTAQASSSPLLMGGRWIGRLHFSPQPTGDSQLQLESNIGDFWVGGFQPGGRKVAYLKEPKVTINSKTKLAQDFSSVDIGSFHIQANRGTANVSGSVKQLTTNPLVDLAGRINADLIGLVKPMGGPATSDLAVNGLRDHQFTLNGPIDPKKLAGTWSTSWQRIHWMGLDGGAANVQLQMKNGLIQTQPIEMAVGGGVVRVAPEVDMTGNSMWIRHPRGFICKDVKLTPEICRHWLKYAAPLLAQVTSVQGSFSLDSDGVEVPLADWTRMVAKARVTINGARVGPGPLGIKISQLVRSVKTLSKIKNVDANTLSQLGLGLPTGQGGSNLINGLLGSGSNANTGLAQNASNQNQKVWMEIPKQTIPVEYNKGAIRHQNLKMSVDGYSLVSTGEVRIDQTIQATANLNVPQDVLKKNPQIASAIGDKMQLPISGTLSQPRVDTQGIRTALLGAAQRGVQDAAMGRLQKELQRKLGDQKLLDIGKGLLGNPGSGNQPNRSLKDEANRLLEKNLNKGLNKIFGNR